MAHQRTVIRRAVRDLLVGKTVAGSRVTATRIQSYRRADVPAIGVYTTDETVDPDSWSTAPREYTRNLSLEIAGWVTPGPGFDDAMDDLAQQIEAAMELDRTLGGAAADVRLESSKMEPRGEGDSLMGLVVLTYSVLYQTQPSVVEGDFADFLQNDATYNLRPLAPPEEDSAEDLITVQELAP